MVGPSNQASKQASKQANIHTHGCNEVTLVWGSLRLAPTTGEEWAGSLHAANEADTKGLAKVLQKPS